jgi:Tfp pilus assembly protein PilV
MPIKKLTSKIEPWSLNIDHYQSGMTLIEVVISMFMLMVLVVFYVSALNTVALTRKQTYEDIAYHAANKQMEVLRGTAFGSLSSSGNISDALLAQIPSGSGNFTVSDYPGYAGMKEMVVTVTWNDGLARSVALKTLAGSGGINP